MCDANMQKVFDIKSVIRIYYIAVCRLLQPIHLRFCRCSTLIMAFARLKIIADVERDSTTVVTLTLIDKHAAGIHSPVVVGSIEYVCCR